jgi:dihydroneopterin triphosphate diphosphatase
MRLPFSVQVFLTRVVNGERRYLLLQRTARPDLGLPPFWQGISGALEPGESFEQAARREVLEETGIQLNELTDTGFKHCYSIRDEWRVHYGEGRENVEEHIFSADVPATVEPKLSPEHTQWRWCSVAEAREQLTFGNNAECLRAVERACQRESR